MKVIEIDEALYQYIAGHTQHIGETASAILRRLLGIEALTEVTAADGGEPQAVSESLVIGERAAASVELSSPVSPVPMVENSDVNDGAKQAAIKSEEKIVQKVVKRAIKKVAAPVETKAEANVAPPVVDISAEVPIKDPSEVAIVAASVSQADTVSQAEPSLDLEAIAKSSAKLAKLNLAEFKAQRGVVGRFMYLLAQLHRANPRRFAQVVELKGRDRLYFATDPDKLSSSGSSVNPKNITDSKYWVLTNSNTERKKWLLNEVATLLSYSPADRQKLTEMLETEQEKHVKRWRKNQNKQAKLAKGSAPADSMDNTDSMDNSD